MTTKTGARVIESVSELTVDFLNDVLTSPIVSFETTQIGTGQLGECHRVALTYLDQAQSKNEPATIILKIAAKHPRSRASGLSLGLYEREIRFYTEMAPSLKRYTGCLATCYYNAFDASTGAFTLLLGDAGSEAIVGDDIKGATFEQAEIAMRELGKLHVGLLADPNAAAWLVREPPISEAFFKDLFAAFEARYRPEMDPSHFEVCQKLVASFGGYQEVLIEPGVCTMGIAHGDYRMDNMLFSPEAVAKQEDSAGSLGLMVVDWQCITLGPIASDMVYFLGCALKTEDRRQWQDSLLRTYCESLAEAAGKPVLTVEGCKKDLRFSAFFGVVMGIVSPIMATQTERGDKMFMTMLARHCELVKDLSSLDLLPEPKQEDLEPLQPQPEEEKQHTPGPEKMWNESWYFDFVDQKQGVAGWIRLGLVPNGKGNWYHAAISRVGQPTVIVADFEAASPDTNLSLKTTEIEAHQSVLDPLQKFHLSVDGTGRVCTELGIHNKDGQSVKAAMELLYETDGVPYQYRITTRYEIPCKVTGTLTIDGGAPIRLDGVPGQRDHSYGVRDWWGMDWVWSGFHLDNGQHIHATHLRLPTVNIGIGYVQQDGKSMEIETLSCQEDLGAGGLTERMQMNIKANGLTTELQFTVTPMGHTAMDLVCDDGRIAFFDRAWGEVSLSTGERGVGWFEWNRNAKE
jgi:hypothetical protein